VDKNLYLNFGNFKSFIASLHLSIKLGSFFPGKAIFFCFTLPQKYVPIPIQAEGISYLPFISPVVLEINLHLSPFSKKNTGGRE